MPTLKAGPVALRGYAIATDARSPASTSRSTAAAAGARPSSSTTATRRWSWTFWHATLDLPAGEHELVVRAWDSAGQTQPARPDDIWNFKGYLSAAWHRVRVTAG